MTYSDLKYVRECLDTLMDELKEVRHDLEQGWDTLLEEIKGICCDLDKGLQDLRPKEDNEPQTDPGKRRSYYPELGDILENISGGRYCVTGVSLDSAVLCNIANGWTMTVHDLGIYDNGKVDWSHSTGGYFDAALLDRIRRERL